MLRDYDIFEKFSDGSTLWKGCILGQHEARRKLQELAEHSENEFFAINIQAGEKLSVYIQDTSQLKAKSAVGE